MKHILSSSGSISGIKKLWTLIIFDDIKDIIYRKQIEEGQ